MNAMLELPSGKILDLNRFVALVPENTTSDTKYELILEGYPHPIYLEPEDAIIVKQHIPEVTTLGDRVESVSHQHNGGWDREEQLRQNLPKMKKLREWIEETRNQAPDPAKEAAFEEFKRIIDAERPEGQKLYAD
jgi:hypothetical protein